MIISYENHDAINDFNSGLMIMATSNHTVLLELINGFRERNNLIRIFDDKYEELDLKKYVDFYGDLINFSGLSSKNITAIINKIIAGLGNDDINNLQHHNIEIRKAIQTRLFMIDVPLSVDFNVSILEIFKNAKIHLEDDIIDNPYDIINLLIRLKIEIDDKSMIVVSNLANYLDDNQLADIHSLCIETGLSILDIEYENVSINRSSTCRYYFIDNDFVDWQY